MANRIDDRLADLPPEIADAVRADLREAIARKTLEMEYRQMRDGIDGSLLARMLMTPYRPILLTRPPCRAPIRAIASVAAVLPPAQSQHAHELARRPSART